MSTVMQSETVMADKRRVGEKKRKKKYSTAAFLTKSEPCCDCFFRPLLLPLQELSITLENRSQRKKGGTTSLHMPSDPAHPDFSPSSVYFLNKPKTEKPSGGKGECRSYTS